ncbi:MAG: rod shape-determining protein MreD [Vicingaceae bacterium]|jgi:rod shape-determining protein MreD
MIKSFVTYPLQFIVFVLLQVLILNNVQLGGTVNPYLYILFILWLPIELNKTLVMGIAFVLGISIDVFTDTMGMHASACVFLAFARPYLLNILAPRDGYELNVPPTVGGLGWFWFLRYATIGVFLHHSFLFFVEVFRFSEFFDTLGRVLASSIFSIVLIFLAQVFSSNAEDRR